MTFETFDQSDEDNFQIFEKNSNFRKMFRFSESFQIFGKFSDFWKIFKILENFQIFGKILDLQKNFRFSEFGRSFSVKSCLLMALIKCLNGSKSLGLLYNCQLGHEGNGARQTDKH